MFLGLVHLDTNMKVNNVEIIKYIYIFERVAEFLLAVLLN